MNHLHQILELSTESGWNCIAVNCTILTLSLGGCASIFMIEYLVSETIKGIRK